MLGWNPDFQWESTEFRENQSWKHLWTEIFPPEELQNVRFSDRNRQPIHSIFFLGEQLTKGKPYNSQKKLWVREIGGSWGKMELDSRWSVFFPRRITVGTNHWFPVQIHQSRKSKLQTEISLSEGHPSVSFPVENSQSSNSAAKWIFIDWKIVDETHRQQALRKEAFGRTILYGTTAEF